MHNLILLLDPERTLSLPPHPVRVQGIDLGTTNSTLAEVEYSAENGLAQAHCLEVDQNTLEGTYTSVVVPSMVALAHGQMFVGEGAKRLRTLATLMREQEIFYDCKNDIGLTRTYHLAPTGFRSAAEIGGHVLAFLTKAAKAYHGTPPTRTVVTVPASFQVAQRHDTLRAATLAGLQLTDGDLLDEPIAAFLDYALTYRTETLDFAGAPKTLVVLDFGGGTCDVALFRLEAGPTDGRLAIETLAVSRYHRLGGGDIDAAIVHEVLIPQLCQQHSLKPFALGFHEKKYQIEPALLGVAEALKTGLCTEITWRQRLGAYTAAEQNRLVKKLPGVYPCPLGTQTLPLRTPQLSVSQFEALLAPFLDRHVLYARETEYRMTCSIFAPLQDALDGSGLMAEQVDYCLLAGGSSLVPQVVEAVRAFFPHAALLTYPHQEAIQITVARGAAYHALALALFGHGMVQPRSHDGIAIRTTAGLVELVSRGVALPYQHTVHTLTVPAPAVRPPRQLRVELVAARDGRTLCSTAWDLPAAVSQGDRLRLDYHYDANQVLHLQLALRDHGDATPFTQTLENPLTHVVNPQNVRLAIEALEEAWRTGKIPASRRPATLVELADKYAELGQREKALAYLANALREKGGADAAILNTMAHLCGELGDYARQEHLLRTAACEGGWPGAWFNLACAYKRRGRFEDALTAIDQALAREREAPYLVLRAQVAQAFGQQHASTEALAEALRTFAPLSTMNDWELGWFQTAAHLAGDQDRMDAARHERQQRQQKQGKPTLVQGHLPAVAQEERDA